MCGYQCDVYGNTNERWYNTIVSVAREWFKCGNEQHNIYNNNIE